VTHTLALDGKQLLDNPIHPCGGSVRPVASKGLADALGWDNLFDGCQSIQD
jgi:hypothetical protein